MRAGDLGFSQAAAARRKEDLEINKKSSNVKFVAKQGDKNPAKNLQDVILIMAIIKTRRFDHHKQ
jgi:hypothetical protein